MEPVHLDKAFELFCNGESFYGPYWDHVLGYWNASLEQPDRILFLKYEEMMEDACFYTKKLAEFMGYGFTLRKRRKEWLRRSWKCVASRLRNLEVNKDGKVGKNGPWEMKNNLFFREGRIRDWENHLTPDMAKHMDFITHSKLSGSDLNLLYHKK
ncbi:cytosolic sulfotransferase 1-like [Hibiscus syriacus]|uniref:cytosolic sulfotransferase 1-like n=1 Tax=Hibiscus syriacus TaxID=106335 RepID=UPI001922EF61|nr:cytosolic sulfotransferase 1-like [Hibiscus syriacus]